MYFKDYKEIEILLQKYFKAVEEADIEILKTIFHEKASMYGYLGKDSVLGTPEIFYNDLFGYDLGNVPHHLFKL